MAVVVDLCQAEVAVPHPAWTLNLVARTDDRLRLSPRASGTNTNLHFVDLFSPEKFRSETHEMQS